MNAETLAAGLRRALRVVTFRATGDDLDQLGHDELAIGLAATWLVGVGRWWDAPDPSPILRLGLGSLVYVLALALFLWLVVLPLRAHLWTYRRVLTFVTLTAPPGLIYALPVERVFSVEVARSVNLWFLAVVATWRLALLVFFLRRGARLRIGTLVVATLLPMAILVVALALLNLDQVAYDFMSGIRDTGNPNDAAYQVVVMLAMLAYLGLVPLVLAYGVLVAVRRLERVPAATDQCDVAIPSRAPAVPVVRPAWEDQFRE